MLREYGYFLINLSSNESIRKLHKNNQKSCLSMEGNLKIEPKGDQKWENMELLMKTSTKDNRNKNMILMLVFTIYSPKTINYAN